MAFIPFVIGHKPPHSKLSGFTPSLLKPNILANRALYHDQQCLPNLNSVTANLRSQQQINGSVNAEPTDAILLPDDSSTESIVPTPVYTPSFFVSLYDLFRQTIRTVEIGRKYGPVYKTSNLFGTLTMITDHAAIVEMSRNPHFFASSNAFPLQFVSLLGHDSFLFADGTKHKTSRGRVSPALMPSITPSFHHTIVQQARKFFRFLVSETSSANAPFSMINPVKKYFLNLVIKIAIKEEQQQNEGTDEPENSKKYEVVADKLSSAFIEYAEGFTSPTFLPAHSKAKQAREILDKELDKLLLDRLHDKPTRAKLRFVRECLQRDKVGNVLRDGGADLMSILIATSSLELPEADDDAKYNSETESKEIRSLSDTLRLLWVAGDATQTSAFLCVVMEIFSDTSLLKRLQHEQSCIDELTAQAVVDKMPLLASVLTESMRVNPAVQMMFRRTTEDVIVLNHFISRGTVIGMDYSSANMDGAIFQDPDQFIPDRFVNKPDLARKVLLFGAIGSVHYCVGASLATTVLKTTLAVMLREFEVDVKPWTRRAVKIILDSIPRDGVWIRSCKENGM